MNLASVKNVKFILANHGIKPSRRLGQNFLVDQSVVSKLVAVAELQAGDTVLEIGPGIGTLTKHLAKYAKKVIAVEKDFKMVEILKKTLAGRPNIEIIHADVLSSNCTLPTTNYKLVANLPYYITAPVIRKFLESPKKPDFERKKVGLQQMTLIVQKEVAQRICAKPPEMSILAVSVQIYAMPKIISYIKKTSFWPAPKVVSSILQITPFTQPYPIDFPKFFTVVKAGFKQPRKQLVNNLSQGLALSRSKTEQLLIKNNIQPAQRAETLSIKDWINLAKVL